MFSCCSYITLIKFVREQCLMVKTIVLILEYCQRKRVGKHLLFRLKLRSSHFKAVAMKIHLTPYRNHHIARIWPSSYKSKAIPLDPCEFGGKLRENTEHHYEPVIANEKSAPVSVVELSFCRCKNGCETKRCTCKKNNLICSVFSSALQKSAKAS